ncbi:hypothetical protein OG754_29255 [Streptomyces decoyicus]|uniref:hypothetical protein n=1 Tax=Streptomyces decoyicus TaxID=249567 RepID=UPI002E32F5EC|nr:hypothetical protein [Streptomyces decoyicus]
MGWTVLYIAFGLVALWLLGEVLLQNKARLRWRLLAFTGFLGVVIGVIIPSIAVIGLGLVAFAIGQTNVTLSFRRGFTTGWALGGKPGASGEGGRRRRARQSGPPPAEPTLEVSGLEAVAPTARPGQFDDGGPDTFESTGGFRSVDTSAGRGSYGGPGSSAGQDAFAAQDTFVAGQEAFAAQDTFVAGQEAFAAQETVVGQGFYDYNGGDGYRAQDPYQDQQQDQGAYATQAFAVPDDFGRPDATAVYAPQPMPEETGQYGVYSPDARIQQPGYGGYDAYNGAVGNGNGDGNGYAYGGGYDQTGAGQGAYADPYAAPYADPYADPYAAYGDGQGQGQQAPYADPYLGGQQYSASYDPYQQADPYAQQPYAAQQYDAQGQPLGQGYGETPPGGVWVPQQRDGELPPEQPYPPYQQPGYDGQQYRY